MNRREKIFHALNMGGQGLEIGPSHRPVAAKREGYDVHVVDCLSTEGLREKYRKQGLDVSLIEEVDFVWSSGPLEGTIGRTSCYDWIIASHVIEHMPDPVGFLCSCRNLLKPDGVLSLVVPDKRYCFDFFRWPSSTGEMLQAHLEKRQRHPPGVVFDQVANAANRDGRGVWDASARGVLAFNNDLARAREVFDLASRTEVYRDVHGWRFTPASLRLILHDIRAMGLIDLATVAEFEPAGCEFYVSLGKAGRVGEAVDRVDLAKAMLLDMKDCLAQLEQSN